MDVKGTLFHQFSAVIASFRLTAKRRLKLVTRAAFGPLDDDFGADDADWDMYHEIVVFAVSQHTYKCIGWSEGSR